MPRLRMRTAVCLEWQIPHERQWAPSRCLVYDEGFRIKKRREAGEEGLLEIRCPENAALRLDKILSSGLGLSREQVKAAIRDGYITGEGRSVSPSTRVNGILRLRVRTGP